MAALAGTLATAPTAGGTPHPPVIDTDWPDPEIVYDEASGLYYSFSTNYRFVVWHNVPVRSSPDLRSWETQYESALPELPPWATEGTTWAPGVAKIGNSWMLYYTARHTASDRQCVGVATSDVPQGPYSTLGSGPIVCQTTRGGTIDASPFQAPDGSWYLLFKSDENHKTDVVDPRSKLWSQHLNASGSALTGSPVTLLVYDHAAETPTIENPEMVYDGGRYYLFYAANWWESAEYREHWGACDGPLGPCRKVISPANPWLFKDDGVAGPGGASMIQDGGGRWFMVFHGWRQAIGYGAGGYRGTYLERIDFDSVGYPRLRFELPRLPSDAPEPAVVTSQLLLRDTASGGVATTQLGWGDGSFAMLACDFDGDGHDAISLFRAGRWYVHHRNTAAVPDTAYSYGTSGDVPLCGDVDGDGRDNPVIYRRTPGESTWYVRSDGLAETSRATTRWSFSYGGIPGDLPLMGDVDSDGTDEPIIYRPEYGGIWYVRTNGIGAGTSRYRFQYGGLDGDVPLIGDWDGDGYEEPVIHRDAVWYLRSTGGDSGSTRVRVRYGISTDEPTLGHWAHPQVAGVGVRR